MSDPDKTPLPVRPAEPTEAQLAGVPSYLADVEPSLLERQDGGLFWYWQKTVKRWPDDEIKGSWACVQYSVDPPDDDSDDGPILLVYAFHCCVTIRNPKVDADGELDEVAERAHDFLEAEATADDE